MIARHVTTTQIRNSHHHREFLNTIIPARDSLGETVQWANVNAMSSAT
jgi:hypothetical protein